MRRPVRAYCAYRSRDATLRTMGYQTYKGYLKSLAWRRTRRRVLRAAGNRCRVCGGRATEVHHTDYSESALRGRDDRKLVPLCRKHHRAIEFSGPRKVGLDAANRALAGLLKKSSMP